MEGATHFIEQYRLYGDRYFFTSVFSIETLGLAIDLTKQYGGTTIAIFKIKYKHDRETNNTSTDVEI